MKTRINIRLNDDLLGMARVKAKSEGTSLTALIEQGLYLVLKLQTPQTQILEQVHTPTVHTFSEKDIQKYIQPLITEYIQKYVQPQLDEQEARLTQLTNGAKVQDHDFSLESIAINQDNLDRMTRDDLRKLARKSGVSAVDKKRKADLIRDILTIYQDNS